MIIRPVIDGHFVDRVVWRGSGEGVLDFANVCSTNNVRLVVENLFMGLFSWDRYFVHQAVMSIVRA